MQALLQFPFLSLSLCFAACAPAVIQQIQEPSSLPTLPYPETPTVAVIDDYHGTAVPDPYRWLEQIESPRVQAGIEGQNRVSSAYLESIPGRAAIRERLPAMLPRASYRQVAEYGGRYFFERRTADQEHSVVYWKAEHDAEPRVLLDPGARASDGVAVRAAAEHLIEIGITSPERLGIHGHSAGGTLVSTALTQRPGLFGAAVISAPVTDLLRFPERGVGSRWIPEYGSPDDPAIFPILHALSPLHDLRSGTCYPATLVLVSDTDETVHPSHAFKFAATLQAAQGCERMVLLRTERDGFHWGGPALQAQEREADRLAFLWHALGGERP